MVVNSITGIVLWKHFSKMNKKTRKTEIRFYAMSLIMFVTQGAAVASQFLGSYLPEDSNERYWVLEFGPIVGDINCLFPLYFLIAVSNEWRTIVFGEKKELARISAWPTLSAELSKK
ncbi:unnamed protein product, partial [Mesorhabditis belari]|uniref:Serpentine receptor class gamma n=1 Tax=Mesorhabditis belari TaxID=2138241 RepID=A0AAF3ENN1_9BILA